MRIALAQINPTIGDFAGNAARILDMASQAAARGATLAVFPELTLMGYPPRDLVEQPRFVDAQLRQLDDLAARLPLPALVGFVARNDTGQGRPLFNAAAFIADGRIVSEHHKSLLPTYDVFDEDRHFEPGAAPKVIELDGRRIGVTICEDLWRTQGLLRLRYRFDPLPALAGQGATAVVNLSASPFSADKMQVRRKLLSGRAKELGLPIVYVNQVGGNDELVFDGGSMVFDANGERVVQAKQFAEDLAIVDPDRLPEAMPEAPADTVETIYGALVLGTRDYLRKCGFKGAIIGSSGGIDSALTLCIAVEALGAENVLSVSMPSRFSSEHSRTDAGKIAANLGVRHEIIPIEPAHTALLDMLGPVFKDLPPDLAEENLQARIRGTVLMALSNKFGYLLLATGNKSELATGYCTLYGDMCGGLAPIGDIPKTMVYATARWINRERETIPEHVLRKAPSAELKPNQTDQDTLPPYEDLDSILHLYVEEQRSFDEIVAAGNNPAVTADVIRRIDGSEHKRRQAVPSLRVTSKAFGPGRRIPIAKRMSERFTGS